MLPYYAVFSLLASLSIFELARETRRARPLLVGIGAIILMLFAGLRAQGVGLDDVNYVRKFLEIPEVSRWLSGEYQYNASEAGMEPLYILLGATVRQFTDSYSPLFLTVAFISVGLSSINYARYSPYACLSLLLYFSHTFLLRDMNQMRAGVAAAIGLFLIAQIARRQHGRVAATIAFAALFHAGALAYIVPWALSFVHWRPKILATATLISAIIGFTGVTHRLVSALPDLGPLTDRIKNYVDSPFAYRISIIDPTNIKNVLILFVSLFLWNSLNQNLRYFKVIILFFATSVIWRLAFSDFAIIAARIATFFGIVEVILVASFVTLFRKKIVGALVVIIYGLSMLLLNTNFNNTPPYQIAGL